MLALKNIVFVLGVGAFFSCPNWPKTTQMSFFDDVVFFRICYTTVDVSYSTSIFLGNLLQPYTNLHSKFFEQ